jgi:transposase InsO family protein
MQIRAWDLTYLRNSALRGAFFYLYLVEDVWSRKIIGWAIHCEEAADLAAALVERIRLETKDHDLSGWVLHSDNGGPMKGATMLATLQRLGVVASFSRPSVSDDNAYAESLFRTLKYRAKYPSKGFASIERPAPGSRASSVGTTPSTSTAESATSRRRRGTPETTSRSWPLAVRPTSSRGVATRSDGPASREPGPVPPPSLSTRKAITHSTLAFSSHRRFHATTFLILTAAASCCTFWECVPAPSKDASVYAEWS